MVYFLFVKVVVSLIAPNAIEMPTGSNMKSAEVCHLISRFLEKSVSFSHVTDLVVRKRKE